ncbi:MAG: helix-turn-helix transcriptional regulator [Deltaproteobacteria bacterium]|nr:helix-turn-helix transcriptional regulator [Deltaproteobacteria bacterium]
MQVAVLHRSRAMSVFDFRCRARPGDPTFDERHERFSVSYVRRGSFGYASQGVRHELVPGALLVGRRGQEFRCSHEHHQAGDECLSVHLSDELAEETGASRTARQAAALPPVPALAVLGELAQQTACGRTGLGLDEVALRLVAGFVATAEGAPPAPVRVGARDRRRAVEAALFLEARCPEPLHLEDGAAVAGLSPFHFLRAFRAVLGVTPHQFLLRARLRRAVAMLAGGAPVTEAAFACGFGDLSNFVRTFRRAAGASPGAFRAASGGARRILQDRLERAR